jgi:hypothetical protein
MVCVKGLLAGAKASLIGSVCVRGSGWPGAKASLDGMSVGAVTSLTGSFG